MDPLTPPVDVGRDLIQVEAAEIVEGAAARHRAGRDVPLPGHLTGGMADEPALLHAGRGSYGLVGPPPGAGAVAGALLFQMSRKIFHPASPCFQITTYLPASYNVPSFPVMV